MALSNEKVAAYSVIGFAILAIAFSCYAIFQPQHGPAATGAGISSPKQLTQDQLAEMQDHVLGHGPFLALDTIISGERKFTFSSNYIADKKVSSAPESSIRVITPESDRENSDAGESANDHWKKMF